MEHRRAMAICQPAHDRYTLQFTMPALTDILGQPRAVESLANALRTGTIHHAYLFAGPEGVGKRTTAEAFAAAVIDPGTGPNLAGDIAPDPDSEHQRLLSSGTHPDLHIITKELAAFSEDAQLRKKKQRNIPVDLLRERMLGGEVGQAKRFHDPIAAMAPSMGDRRVFILDEAELLERQGANALLKTLEEPAATTIIILITSSEQRVLPTIRSRCQRIAFTSLDDDAMTTWAQRANVDFGEGALDRDWILRFATGSPGVALLAASTGLLAWRDELSPMLDDVDAGVFPSTFGASMASLVDTWAQAWVKANAGASKEAANRRAASLLIRLLAMRVRDDFDHADQPGALARGMRRASALADVEVRLRANVSPKLTFAAVAAAWAEQSCGNAAIFAPA